MMSTIATTFIAHAGNATNFHPLTGKNARPARNQALRPALPHDLFFHIPQLVLAEIQLVAD